MLLKGVRLYSIKSIGKPTILAVIIGHTTLGALIHDYLGVSWHLLVPMVIIGGLLMLYSTVRLLIGEHLHRRFNKNL